jgi:YggT family protein
MPYIQNALSFTTETILGLYLIIVILRFMFQLFQVDFRNPVSQMVVMLTNFPLKFLQQFIPGLFGIDLASIALALAIGFAKIALLLTLSGIRFNFPGTLVLAVAEIINISVWILIIAILVSAVLSWVAPRSHNPATRIVAGISEPALRPFRRIIPAMSGIDLSPLLALLVLNLVQRLIVHPVADFGKSLIIQ